GGRPPPRAGAVVVAAREEDRGGRRGGVRRGRAPCGRGAARCRAPPGVLHGGREEAGGPRREAREAARRLAALELRGPGGAREGARGRRRLRGGARGVQEGGRARERRGRQEAALVGGRAGRGAAVEAGEEQGPVTPGSSGSAAEELLQPGLSEPLGRVRR